MGRLPDTDIAPNVAGRMAGPGVRPVSRPFDLVGKIALVTGASGGLGRHFARTLATAGARVALAARRTEQTKAVAAEIEESGGGAIAVSMDVTEQGSVERALSETSERLGVPTVVINNSASPGTSRRSILRSRTGTRCSTPTRAAPSSSRGRRRAR